MIIGKVDRVAERQRLANYFKDASFFVNFKICATCQNCKPVQPYSVAYLFCVKLRFKIMSKRRFGYCRYWKSAR